MGFVPSEMLGGLDFDVSTCLRVYAHTMERFVASMHPAGQDDVESLVAKEVFLTLSPKKTHGDTSFRRVVSGRAGGGKFAKVPATLQS